MEYIEKYRQVQSIAKQVHIELANTISELDSEKTIAEKATNFLAIHKVTETWYHDCPAFVLLGSRSRLSISGRNYIPSNEQVGIYNLITVDLSPSIGGLWGDCARSFFVEEGHCVQQPKSLEFIKGAEFQKYLHSSLFKFATPDTTFENLYYYGNSLIENAGFQNLDFLGNLGHSIEKKSEDRRYIEKGNSSRLSDASFFTFEPHICATNSVWGFKHENIYYFNKDGILEEL
jgi:Xaa-Pro aminopeptidase